MQRTKREACNQGRVAYVVTTWDDETGDASILEYDADDGLVRRCEWTHWQTPKGDLIGEAVWFSPDGVELERRPLRTTDS